MDPPPLSAHIQKLAQHSSTTHQPVTHVALPNRHVSPPKLVKLSVRPSVSCNIAGNLLFPVRSVARRHPTMGAAMPVPETPVDEDCQLEAAYNKIGTAGTIEALGLEFETRRPQRLGD